MSCLIQMELKSDKIMPNTTISQSTSSFSATAIHFTKHRRSSVTKAIRESDLDACSSECVQFLQRELWVCRALCHPNVLVHDIAFVEEEKLYVINEFMNYGACSDVMESHFKFGLPEVLIAHILSEVIHALEYIHKLGYIHRGVKARHILLSSNGRVKLSSNRSMISMLNEKQRRKNVHDFPKHDIYLLPWLSPEILQQNIKGYDTQSDIYSLGITTCELANGHAPFTDMPNARMLLEKLNGTKPCLLDQTTVPPEPELIETHDGQNSEAIQQHQITMSRTFSEDFHQLASSCLNVDPSSRPTATQLLNHPFLQHTALGKENFATLLLPLTPVLPETQKLSSPVDRMVAEASGKLQSLNLSQHHWEF
ncbi:STE20-related kinase adapter protein alpha-like isoform X2 [Clavelina lepadiformis]|uniref:STE20-related kinase adapter protein alpha-like isoform X2 n=1 Tax=Clavelina lepadiformis TaxID=159417 RepID=UPI00404320FF